MSEIADKRFFERQRDRTPTKYGVPGIPTLIMFKNGQPASVKIGALPKNKLQEWIQSSL